MPRWIKSTTKLECYKVLLEEDRVMSSDAIKSRYLGEDGHSETLKELIAYHKENMVYSDGFVTGMEITKTDNDYNYTRIKLENRGTYANKFLMYTIK